MTEITDGEYTVTEETLPATTQGRGVTVIQAPQPKELDLSSPAKLEAAVAQIENALTYKNRIMELALRTARPGAIMSQGASPYFTESEAERILSMMGGGRVVILQPPQRYEDGDGHFGFTAAVEVSHTALGTFQGWGSAHSSDQFLGTNNDTSRRQLHEVDRHNIAQHALTHAKGAALRNMLGLNGLTWEDLKAFGYDPDSAGAKVEYKNSKSNGNGSRKPAAKKAAGKKTMSAVGRRMYAVACERFGDKAKIPYDALSAYASEQCGYTGQKILDAPDDVLGELTDAIKAGIFDPQPETE